MEIGSSEKRSMSPEMFLASPVDRLKKFKKKKSLSKSRNEKNKKVYEAFKNKLQKILPAVFKKDVGRGNYIFELFCDIIRMNNLIDTCDDMGSLDFIMTQQRISRALDNFFSIRGILTIKDNDTTTARYLENYMTLYRCQFQELSWIGRGGFGCVVKAKHYLDGLDYAIKKVYIEQQRSEEIVKCLEEVKILAQLNHPNVVAYKQAWIEPCNDTDLFELSQSSQSGSQTGTDYYNTIRKDIGFLNILSTKNGLPDKAMQVDEASQNSQENESRVVLYIQMSLCHQNLREWMDGREEFSTSSEIEEIMIQILSGLKYIHNRGVIHHDIKPQNIFISVESGKISVQLGDFGLACECQKIEHSQEIGTRLYVAPEQLKKKCDPKSDIYSCGIVLFEVVYPMQTEMERHLKIQELKKGQVPSEVIERYPFWMSILKKATQDHSNLRLSAGELLDMINFKDSLKVTKLKEENKRLKEENNLLKAKFGSYF
ncbi:eukaryotic translation initiation factor 2-alpha kinase 1-like [Phymastichus coffea]|uniref:eukaryotic translation initiation factor 2-alpha kinase 1-like n=1 Tax=Phymastichus coffea TaxID=108790 RepID=UPI00273BDF43|nr:eukaryotic translation initiation factor 2-alpha kinase 1-like [Phymastichus coffea]